MHLHLCIPALGELRFAALKILLSILSAKATVMCLIKHQRDCTVLHTGQPQSHRQGPGSRKPHTASPASASCGTHLARSSCAAKLRPQPQSADLGLVGWHACLRPPPRSDARAGFQTRMAGSCAQVRSCGMAGDAHHLVQPDPAGSGAELAMVRALQAAGLRPQQVCHLNAHAASTPVGDAIEAAGIAKVRPTVSGHVATLCNGDSWACLAPWGPIVLCPGLHLGVCKWGLADAAWQLFWGRRVSGCRQSGSMIIRCRRKCYIALMHEHSCKQSHKK